MEYRGSVFADIGVSEFLEQHPDFEDRRRKLIFHYIVHLPTGEEMIRKFPGVHPDDFWAVLAAFDADDAVEMARILKTRKESGAGGYGPVFSLDIAYNPSRTVLAIQTKVNTGGTYETVRDPKFFEIPPGFDPADLHPGS